MLFKGNSSKLELLIEKIQANKESTDTLGTDPSLSWNSETADEDQNSLSPSSCATPNSVTTEGNDTEVTFTIGPTESTPYACQFCEKAFPRLSYLKKHEQSHSDQMPFKCDFCQRLFKHKRSRDRHVKLHTGDKKYRCPHCESAFSRSDHLKIHMKTHDHQKPYQCVICNRGYNTAAALTSHMQNHKKESIHSSPSPGPFRCLQCTGTFLTGEELQAHVSHHHRPISSSTPEKQEGGNGKRLAGSPKTPSSSPSSRIRNADLDHPSSRLMIPFPLTKLACIYCTKDSFTTMEALQLHVQAMHGPLLNGDLSESPLHMSPIETPSSTSPSDCISSVGHLACNFCTMKFPNLSSLHKHAMSVHSLSGYLQAKAKENAFCAQCAIAFPNSIAYAEHFLIFHANPHTLHRKPVQVCSPEPPQVKPTDLSKKNKADSGSSSSGVGLIIPAKKIKREDDESHCGSIPLSVAAPMLTNPAISFGPHSLLCNQCNAGFSDFESFRTHLKSHLEEVVHKFVCEECESEFGTEEQLENHAMAHYLTTTTEYGCQSCLKLFGKPDELQKHLMDIHAHHLYRCALCKEMFDSKVSIQVHFAVKHSNECKLFRCTSCTTIFRSEIEFQVHVKMAHLRKLSPYRCLLCSASFGNELDLQFHLSTHQKQFRCKMCDEAFHVEFLLDKHMQTHHSSVINGDGDATPSNHATSSNNSKSNKKGSGSSGLGKGKELKCDICDKSIGSESELTSHRKLVHHISASMNPCSSVNSSSDRNCGGNSSSGKSGHHKSTHNNSHSGGQTGGSHTVSLHCAYCNENCKSRSDLENHMKSHQIVSSGKHKCNICDEVCPTATLLAEHKLTHCKVITGSLCTGCKLNIISEEQFYTHMKQHCPNNSGNNSNGGTSSSSVQLPMPCIVCRQTLMTDIEIQMHARFHTKQYESSNNGSSNSLQSSIQCCICFRHEEKSRFVLNGLSNGVQTFLCQDCYRKGAVTNSPKTSPHQHHRDRERGNERDGMKYSDFKYDESKGKGNSTNNNNSNNNRRTYQCIKCQMSFASEEDIQSHVATHLMNEGSNHECHLCSHVFFDSPLKLQCHLIEHTFEGCSSFTCYMCSAVFTTATGLQQHMLEHGLHSRPYDCSHCHLKFFFRAELENHIVSHEQLKQAIVETYPPNDYSKCVLNLTQDSTGNRQSHHRKSSSVCSNTNSNGHNNNNNMKPKKFFYRSDDSDEEMESTVTIKKEEKRDYEQISPNRINGDGFVSDESFDDRNKLGKTPLQDRQDFDDIDDHINGRTDKVIVKHESDRDSS